MALGRPVAGRTLLRNAPSTVAWAEAAGMGAAAGRLRPMRIVAALRYAVGRGAKAPVASLKVTASD